jgi:hypothetical protein
MRYATQSQQRAQRSRFGPGRVQMLVLFRIHAAKDEAKSRFGKAQTGVDTLGANVYFVKKLQTKPC